MITTVDISGQNVEWIVEDFDKNGSLVVLCDFGTITFTDTSASAGSSTVVLTNGDIVDIDITQDNEGLTATTIDSSTSMTVTYQ
ncbi:peptidase G1 [Lentinula guzmanii]|uniref:Peptidase G1 n=1 Tax=Lentinula guzmanii TaxID=2804957 RepID=A0AA38J6F1_9AGAR|nr:peptidase G1 [Lentinula guzmanii]